MPPRATSRKRRPTTSISPLAGPIQFRRPFVDHLGVGWELPKTTNLFLTTSDDHFSHSEKHPKQLTDHVVCPTNQLETFFGGPPWTDSAGVAQPQTDVTQPSVLHNTCHRRETRRETYRFVCVLILTTLVMTMLMMWIAVLFFGPPRRIYLIIQPRCVCVRHHVSNSEKKKHTSSSKQNSDKKAALVFG